MDGRISKIEWALRLAEVTAYRSEDPYQKVGAVAMTFDGRVIATAYNGLAPGREVDPSFWENRNDRLKFMFHAEQNLCSLIKRDEAFRVATTLSPCPSCLLLLAAHGIKHIYYREEYKRPGAEAAREVADFYGIHFEHVPIQKPDMRPGDIMHVPGYGFLHYGGHEEPFQQEYQASFMPTHPSHKLLNEESCDCRFDPDRDKKCPVCDHGLAVCATCGKAENELDKPCVDPRK